jgi:hypothetical protein
MGKIMDGKIRVKFMTLPDFDYYADKSPAHAIIEATKGYGKHERNFQVRIPVAKAKEYGLDKVKISAKTMMVEEKIDLIIHGEWKVEWSRDEDGEWCKLFYVLVS